MKYISINEAAKRLNMTRNGLKEWLVKEENPLEIISGIKIEKVNGKWIVPEKTIIDYENFIASHCTIKQIEEITGFKRARINNWILKGRFKNPRKINKIYYIPIYEVTPLTDVVKAEDIVNELRVSRITVISYLNKGLFKNAFTIGNIWYIPRSSLVEVKNKYYPVNQDEYITPGEAAKTLGILTSHLKKLLDNDLVELNAVKVGPNKKSLIRKEDVYAYKSFLASIDQDFYTVKQIANKLNCSISTVHKFMDKFKGVKWIKLKSQFQQIVPKESFNLFVQREDLYRLLKPPLEKATFKRKINKHDKHYYLTKPETPLDIFTLMIDQTLTPSCLKNTVKYFVSFFQERQSCSNASLPVQQRDARQCGYLYKELVQLLTKEITQCSDSEIKHVFQMLKTGNSRKFFYLFLQYIEKKTECSFSANYKLTSNNNIKGKEKETYSIQEFYKCKRYIQDIEFHIDRAITDRTYAVTWLYVSLHFTNAWRSSDFMTLPPVRTDLVGIDSLDWFREQNRLSVSQAQRIINQYASKRLVASKTGALNKFLVNLDMLVPIATMITICNLHRLSSKDNHLLSVGTRRNRIRENHLKQLFTPFPFHFSSRKMNRTFMTLLFHKAAQDAKNKGIALELTARTRAHLDNQTTTIYIQSTNEDGPLDNISVNLCKRGHFGFLYDLLLESFFTFNKEYHHSTTFLSDDPFLIPNFLEQRTNQIHELRNIFPTPLNLERFGSFLQEQQQEKNSLAIRVAQMSKEEIKQKLVAIYEDRMPSHPEHAQCFIHPNCIYPKAHTCIGCPNIIPKNYLLISLKHELLHRLQIIRQTMLSAVAERESSWIIRLLSVLQEAVDSYGEDYVKSFIDIDQFFTQIVEAFERKEQLILNSSLTGVDDI